MHNLFLHSALVLSRKIPDSVQGINDACKYFLIESGFALAVAFLINVSIISVSGTVCSSENLSTSDVERCSDLTLKSASFLLKVLPGGWTAIYVSLDNVGVWNLRDENLDRWYLGQETYMRGLLRVQGRPATAYDDQGLVFAIAFGGFIRMFDVRNYEKGPFEIFSVGGDMSDANAVKYSNDGRLMLLTTMDGHIHVLDSFRGTLLNTFNVKPVSSTSTLDASFSPEGSYVISGSGDGSVFAWSVRSGKEAASWMSTETEPPVIRWAPGSLMFVTGSSELSFWIPDLSKLATYVGRK